MWFPCNFYLHVRCFVISFLRPCWLCNERRSGVLLTFLAAVNQLCLFSSLRIFVPFYTIKRNLVWRRKSVVEWALPNCFFHSIYSAEDRKTCGRHFSILNVLFSLLYLYTRHDYLSRGSFRRTNWPLKIKLCTTHNRILTVMKKLHNYPLYVVRVVSIVFFLTLWSTRNPLRAFLRLITRKEERSN